MWACVLVGSCASADTIAPFFPWAFPSRYVSTVAEANPSLGLGASSTWAVYAAALASLALLLLCASGAFGAGAGDAPDDASLLPMSIRGRPHAPRRRGQRQPRALCASAAFYVGVALPLGVLLPLHWDLTATASWGATARCHQQPHNRQ